MSAKKNAAAKPVPQSQPQKRVEQQIKTVFDSATKRVAGAHGIGCRN